MLNGEHLAEFDPPAGLCTEAQEAWSDYWADAVSGAPTQVDRTLLRRWIAADKLTAQACEDCVPVLELMRAPGIAGEVIVAIVRHQDSCPWYARVQPDPDSPIGTPYGVRIDCVDVS